MKYATIMGQLFSFTERNWNLLASSRGKMPRDISAYGVCLGECPGITDWTETDWQMEHEYLMRSKEVK